MKFFMFLLVPLFLFGCQPSIEEITAREMAKLHYPIRIPDEMDVSRVLLGEDPGLKIERIKNLKKGIDPRFDFLNELYVFNSKPFNGVVFYLTTDIKTYGGIEYKGLDCFTILEVIDGLPIGESRSWDYSNELMTDSEKRAQGVIALYGPPGKLREMFVLKGSTRIHKEIARSQYPKEWMITEYDKNDELISSGLFPNKNLEKEITIINKYRKRATLSVLKEELEEIKGLYYFKGVPHTGYVFFVDFEKKHLSVQVIRDGTYFGPVKILYSDAK